MRVLKMGRLLVPREARVDWLNVDPSSVHGAIDKIRPMISGIPKRSRLRPRHHKLDLPLFADDPELGDIHQKQMGDCWFLAALAAALVQGGPFLIDQMMVDLGDFVVVQLWDCIEIRRFIAVEKSTVELENTPIVMHSTGGLEGSLWPAMLEKAMTAFHKDPEENGEDASMVYDPKNPSYEYLSGGSSARAFEVLLGVETETRSLAGAIYHYDATSQDFDLLRAFLRGGDVPLATVRDILAPRGEPGYFLIYQNWCNWVGATGNRLYIQFLLDLENKNGLGGVFRDHDMERYITQFVSQPMVLAHWNFPERSLAEVAASLIDWIKRRRIFAGKRGTGIYTQNQVALWEEIDRDLRLAKPVCLGSREAVGTPEPVVGSSGEPRSKGLVGRHAYAVLATHHDRTNGMRYLKVFNPHGRYGRGYSFLTQEQFHQKPNQEGQVQAWEGHKAYATDSPIFWLPLADLTKRFNKVYLCKKTPEPVRIGRRLLQVL